MDKRTCITLGNSSQSHRKYGSSSGKQCTGMCLGFMIYSDKLNLLKLKSRDVDIILDIGNDIYESCSSHYEVEILAGDEIPTDITYDGVRYKLARGQMRYGFIQDFRSLTFQITNVFCTYTHMILICKGYSVMLKYVNGHYFLFDSHKKDKFGRKHADGKASVIRFNTFNEMIQYVSVLFQSDKREQYDIVPIQVKQELAKAGSSRDIRCYFRRKQGNVVHQYESDVMPISSDEGQIYGSFESIEDFSPFHTYRKRKTPWMSSSQHESEIEHAKRLKSDVSTCVLGPHNTVLYVDDDCTDMSNHSFSSDMRMTDNGEPRVRGEEKSKRRTLQIKKIGNGWCVVKATSNPVLRQRDKKQIEEIKSSLLFPHGTVVTLVKEKGLWSVVKPSMSTSKTRVLKDVTNQNYKDVAQGLPISSSVGKGNTSNCRSKSSLLHKSNDQFLAVGKENVNPIPVSTHHDLTSETQKQSSYRQNLKSKKLIRPAEYDFTLDDGVITSGNINETNESVNVINLGLEKETHDSPCSDNVSQESKLSQSGGAIRNRAYRLRKKAQPKISQLNSQDTILSDTISAQKQRNYRVKKKLAKLAQETQLENSESMQSQDNNVSQTTHLPKVSRRVNLSETPKAIKQREYRAKKKAESQGLLEPDLQVSKSQKSLEPDILESPLETLESSCFSAELNQSQFSSLSGIHGPETQDKDTDFNNGQEMTECVKNNSELGLCQGDCVNDGNVLKSSRQLSMTASAIRQREYRAKKRKSFTNSQSDSINSTNVLDSNVQYRPDVCQSEIEEIQNTSPPKKTLSMTPSAIRQRAYRAKRKSTCNSETESIESDVDIYQNGIDFALHNRPLSMTKNAVRLRAARRRNREKELEVSTSEDENYSQQRLQEGRRKVLERVRNYRISRRRTPLYQAPVFQNNEWSVNTHYGNPCNSVTTHLTDIVNNDFSLEVPNDTSEIFPSIPVENENCDGVEEGNEDCDSDTGVQNTPIIDFHFEDDETPIQGEVQHFEITASKMSKLNESVDQVCVFCTKLCFTEQGKYYSGLNLDKYRMYLSPDFSENRAFICSSCKGQISKGKAPTFNKHNGIHWPRKVPELDLMDHEERLICLRIPFMHIQILPSGGQRSLKGNVINVPADIHETIFMLPRHINDQGTVSVKLKRRLCYKAVYQDSNVRPVKILEALQYLKQNSLYYQSSNLQVSDTWLSETIEEIANTGNMEVNNVEIDSDNQITIPHYLIDDPSDGEVRNSGHGNDAENYEADRSGSEDNFSEVGHTEVPAVHDTMLDIIPRNVSLNVAPGEGQRPLHLLYDKKGEEMSFPTIYCGKGIDEVFPANFNFIQRSRWELTSEDRRVAQKPELIFYKYKMYQLDYIREQGKLALRFIKHDKEYTAKDLRTDEQRTNIATVDDGFFFYRKLRNSPQYLQQKKRELFATIRQLGIPTFFISLSAADTKWPELLQSLGKIVDGKTYSLEEIENMSFSERTRLVNSDPVTCARYFDRRFQFFLKHIIYKDPYPLGPITDHFYRIEFQHRGSPHVHMILFSERAPKYNKNGDNTAVIEYIDKYISCSLEPREEANQYINYQVHKHSKTCRKGGRPTCRFHYPLPPFEKTVILRHNPEKTQEEKDKYIEIQRYLDSDAINSNTTLDDVLRHFSLTYEQYETIVRSSIMHDKVFLRRKPSECRVNMYICNLLHVWKANMDCQFCLDPYSVVSYIVNYINKENRGLSLNLATVTRECESEKKSIRETIKKLGNVFLNTSEISVQECVYVLLGMSLTHQSVDVEIVNTAVPEKRVKVVKNPGELVGTRDESTDIFKDSIYDIYAKRPLYFKDWAFADYITIVRILPRTARSKQLETEGLHFTKRHTRYYLDENKKYSIGRRRVLSFLCPPKSQNEEEYFRIQLLLFHPWTVEPMIHENCSTYKEMYRDLSSSEKDDLHDLAKSYSKQNLQSLQELYQSLMNDVSNLIVAPGADQTNADDVELGAVSLCPGFFFRPSRRTLDDTRSGTLEHAVNTNQETVNSLWPHDEICESVVNLNSGQRDIFDHIISEIISGERTLRLFITGGAGAGKTFLLHTIHHAVSRFYNLQPSHIPSAKAVVKVAITGKAAFLIRGETIHGGLGIRPKNSYEFYERMSADQLNTMQVKFRGTKILMIDEVSMVGHNFFRFINIRLQDIMANDEPFGGLHVICFGDLYQLPPVKEKWIFENNEKGLSSLEINLWTEYFYLYELTEIMRQREEYEFAQLLNRMRVGKLIQSDFVQLQTRVVPAHESNDGLDCLHIFSTNVAADDYNRICFNKCDSEKEQVVAVDTIVEVVSTDVKALVIKALNKKNVYGGVARCLDLAVGLTYDLTQNINVQDGLFNGTSGVLRFIQYMTGFEKPVALWFEFDEELIGKIQRDIYSHYRTQEMSNIWTPVFAITREFKLKEPKSTIRRKQFPVHQSTGKTIHKSQGCTLPEIAIQLSDFTHRNGFYVACSRVPKLSNLHILNFAPNQILTDKKVSSEMERLQRERLLPVQRDSYPNKEKWFCIYYCNIQSLPIHITYLQRDKIALSSNLMLFNETHLTPLDLDHDITIHGFHHFRFDAEITETGRRPYNGLILYVRTFFDVNILMKYRHERFEYMLCNVKTGWDTLTVALVYIKPQTSHVLVASLFDHIFQNDIQPGSQVSIIGDFNLNILAPENYMFLNHVAERYDLSINDTKFTTNRQTTIDLCLSGQKTNVHCHYVPWSYHTALTCQF